MTDPMPEQIAAGLFAAWKNKPHFVEIVAAALRAYGDAREKAGRARCADELDAEAHRVSRERVGDEDAPLIADALTTGANIIRQGPDATARAG